MRSIKVWVVCAAVVLIAITSYGSIPHVLYGKRIAGQVVDAGTGQPINGAHVAFLWESDITPHSFTAHNSRTICYHAAAAVTNEQGYFEIAPWREWSTYGVDIVEPHISMYGREYQPAFVTLHSNREVPRERLNERYELKRFSGTVGERMDALFWGLANRGCPYGKASQTALYPMLKSIYQEAKSLAQSDQQRSRTSIIAEFAADAALARNPNDASNLEEIQRFIRSNLE